VANGEEAMDENKVEGTVREATGKVQDAVGGITGDTATQLRGKAKQAAGQAQQVYSDTAEEVRQFASDQPLTTILLSVGFGFLLGYLVSRR
jgi:uncharacterized protein YjbJ (UPF0337 family)